MRDKLQDLDASELDRLQTHATAALRAVQAAQMRARQNKPHEAEQFCLRGADNVRAIVGALHDAGAKPSGTTAEALADPIQLEHLNTPALRSLLLSLRQSMPFAEAVDKERGRSGSEVVGGSAGLDLAEQLAQMIARVDLELNGPDGKRLE